MADALDSKSSVRKDVRVRLPPPVVNNYQGLRPNSSWARLLENHSGSRESNIRLVGPQDWPRLFHNLRASWETDQIETFPVQVVTNWLGDTPAVAVRHYRMTTDAHFEAAIKGHAGASGEVTKKAAQQAHAMERTEPQTANAAHEKTPVLPGLATSCGVLHKCSMEDRGLEPLTFWLPARRAPN